MLILYIRRTQTIFLPTSPFEPNPGTTVSKKRGKKEKIGKKNTYMMIKEREIYYLARQ